MLQVRDEFSQQNYSYAPKENVSAFQPLRNSSVNSRGENRFDQENRSHNGPLLIDDAYAPSIVTDLL